MIRKENRPIKARKGLDINKNASPHRRKAFFLVGAEGVEPPTLCL